MPRRIAVVDYHKGNLLSVVRSATEAGGDAEITDEPKKIASASGLIIPGVGSFEDAMIYLEESGEKDAVLDAVERGVPLLGILPGKVRRFPDTPGFKIPEIGWNQVNGGTEYYFVHSYYAELGPYTTGTTEYAGVAFTSRVQKGSLLATQFHPEKSGKAGLALLKEFLAC